MLYKINTEFKKYESLDSIKDLLEELSSQKTQITILDLSLNTFMPLVFIKIAEIIKEMENLKNIKLESIFDSLTFEEMTEVLRTLCLSLPPGLKSFELPSNAVSCNFPDEFGLFLEKSKLQVINLHNCGLGEDGLKKIAIHLSKIEDKENLIKLDISKNRINVICPEFINIFKEFKNIKELIMNANTIEEKSMEQFLKEIKNEKLEILNLTDNFVCGKAIKQLGELFLRNDFKELYLQDIKVDEGDIYELLKLFNLKKAEFPGEIDFVKDELILDISCNYFEQNCVELLENLCELVKFKKLIIFENNFEDIEKLKDLVIKEGGMIVFSDEESSDSDSDFSVDEELIEKLKNL